MDIWNLSKIIFILFFLNAFDKSRRPFGLSKKVDIDSHEKSLWKDTQKAFRDKYKWFKIIIKNQHVLRFGLLMF